MTNRAKSIHDWAMTAFAISMIPGIWVSSAIFEYIKYGTPLF